MTTDLAFYDPSAELVEVYATEGGNLFNHAQNTVLGEWTQVLAGIFTDDGLSQLLFYYAPTGTVQLFDVEAPGESYFELRHETGSWRPGCRLVAGCFSGSAGGDGNVVPGLTQILAYDPAAGTGDFYYYDGGPPELNQHYAGWRTSWSRIVAGNFGGNSLDDLLFYEASSGTGEFYVAEGTGVGTANGGLNLLRSYSGWRNSWEQIVPGNFGSSAYTDLLFYDGMGTGEIWSVDQGNIALMEHYDDWRTNWKEIISGEFGDDQYVRTGEPGKDLLFYDGAGTGQFWTVDDGNITLLQTQTNWRSTWTQIVSGVFTKVPEPVVRGTLPTPKAFVTVSIQPFSPNETDYKFLQITGGGFQANENVDLDISVQDGVGPRQAIPTLTIQADAAGDITFEYSGSGGGVCNPPGSGLPTREYWVQGAGVTSHRTSLPATASCMP